MEEPTDYEIEMMYFREWLKEQFEDGTIMIGIRFHGMDMIICLN